MNRIKLALIAIFSLMLVMPLAAYAGSGDIDDISITTDSGSSQLVSYYDLRNRESYVQVSNTDVVPANIHVQIFRNDFANCQDLNFYDTLTASDTHIYDMSNIVGNTGPVNAVLDENSHGVVVITLVDGVTNGSMSLPDPILIGNFRIVDDSGYEYRTNSAGFAFLESENDRTASVRYTLNFNQLGGNNQADIIGIEIDDAGPGFSRVDVDDVDVIPFIFNDAENPTSCDEFEFDCGVTEDEFALGVDTDTLNVGINDIFPSTNGELTLCDGNQDVSGFVELITDELGDDDEIIVGYVGLNNGNGTGSMDSWIGNDFSICEFLEDDFDGDCGDIE